MPASPKREAIDDVTLITGCTEAQAKVLLKKQKPKKKQGLLKKEKIGLEKQLKPKRLRKLRKPLKLKE